MEMTKLRKDYEHILEISVYRRVAVTVCTSAPESTVHGFMEEISHELYDIIKEVKYQQLPYNEVEKLNFKDKEIDAMILCHSIQNRRFAITDVKDALYTRFLPIAVRELGKSKVGVIVHDLPTETILDDNEYEEKMESFRRQQPTTFKNASMVFISGQLSNSPSQLGPGNWTELQTFIAKASRFSEAPPYKALRKVLLPAVIVFLVLLSLILLLSIELS
ncbi:uncharacterized protein LOC129256103 [Lytechinus pictus]|uniref:uncharacterized protein LOC129256103 n=1 Tax=Lytechinus pictus TaxID=7653 RepID=UPI00240E4CE3|nr:uncharacterized protein LOC129256103 [Lytechinus pictus]